jgi:hypothetical protein
MRIQNTPVATCINLDASGGNSWGYCKEDLSEKYISPNPGGAFGAKMLDEAYK